MVGVIKGSDYNVIEGNTFYETGTNINDAHTAAFKINNSVGNIFRRNIVYDMDKFVGQIYNGQYNNAPQYNMFYHNTSYNSNKYKEEPAYGGNYVYSVYYAGQAITNNQVVNNIISESPNYAFGHGHHGYGTQYLQNNIYRGNHLYNITGDEVSRYAVGMTISSAQTNYSSEYYDNTNNDLSDPKFTNAGSNDFTLQSDSPCINTGLWLSTITSATGSGTSFVVGNPYFFTDGHGVITGDVIKTENGQSATITDITGSTITVDRSISWIQNEGIALDYEGSKPDIGAYEYSLSENCTNGIDDDGDGDIDCLDSDCPDSLTCNSTTIRITTDENATCKYCRDGVGGCDLDTTYDEMSGTFEDTGELDHITDVGIPCGASYLYHIRCMDGVGNKNGISAQANFNIAAGE
jgi:hypothetical protein